MLDVSLQLITCKVCSASGKKRQNIEATNVESCLFYIQAGEVQLPAQVSSRNIISEQHTQSLSDAGRRRLAVLK